MSQTPLSTTEVLLHLLVKPTTSYKGKALNGEDYFLGVENNHLTCYLTVAYNRDVLSPIPLDATWTLNEPKKDY